MKLKSLVITACILSAVVLGSFLMLCISCLSISKTKNDSHIPGTQNEALITKHYK